MRKLALAVAVLALVTGAAGAQQEKNLPNNLVTVEAGDVKVRYLHFLWDEEAFTALEKGGGASAGTRSWALGRILTPDPIEPAGPEGPAGHRLTRGSPGDVEWRASAGACSTERR